ncbi:acetolactate synthase [Sulfuriroseicoccus oceanibius]|uniref:Acetolactate synthase n=1 Tax=Sulfuriroseicoccus oceanibius TaxID=2707525 RepID=A0A6B3LBE3_9BACT|nr:acetolactate synthase [Sulfuriroseicoccus oceanibius]QQL44147.1 acetolactate synthase [Sulfuriroseicoccus oceanibius]
MSSPIVKQPGDPVMQFSVFLPSKLGTLMRLVKLLEGAHVQVLGMSLHDSTDATVVRVVVSDPDIVEQLFYERGIPFSSLEMIAVELADGAAGLGRCLSALLEGEVNLLFSYPLMNRPGLGTVIVMHVEDTPFGINVLQRNGYKVLFQGDLTR